MDDYTYDYDPEYGLPLVADELPPGCVPADDGEGGWHHVDSCECACCVYSPRSAQEMAEAISTTVGGTRLIFEVNGTSESYERLPKPVALSNRLRHFSDADLDNWVMTPSESTTSFARRVLEEFASRHNPPRSQMDCVHLGVEAGSRTRDHDDFAIFAEVRGLMRRREAEAKRVGRSRAKPGFVEAEYVTSTYAQVERMTERLRVLSDLDIEESAYALDWSMPEIENRWDRFTHGGREHMAVFADLTGMLTAIDHSEWFEEAMSVSLSERYDEMILTHGEYADRLCRYVWDDGYFSRKKVPWYRRVGRIHTGGFVTFPNGERYATCVVRKLVQNSGGSFTPEYLVFWREDLGSEITYQGWRGSSRPPAKYGFVQRSTLLRSDKGALEGIVSEWVKRRKVQRWRYSGHLKFGDRTQAMAFAHRLTSLARTEAALERDSYHGLPGASGTDPDWWQHEPPYDPSVLMDRVGGADDPSTDGTGAA